MHRTASARTRSHLRRFAALALLPLLAAPQSFGWGDVGHRMISRLAVETLPADVPAFLRSAAAADEIEYLGPEPDRWRSPAEPELNAMQAPDHFIDLEYADMIGTLPRRRYDYIKALEAAQKAHPDLAEQLEPARVGFQPYITNEVWERLKAAMRAYRELSAQHANTRPVEAAILFYAGWLGHYVGDGSMPLHTSRDYNGWVEKENPNGYTTEHTIHGQFESAFVSANIKPGDVKPLMTPVHPVTDEWDAYLAYLRHTHTLVEKVYQLDKQNGFIGAGTPEAKQFTAERLAAAASELRDLIDSAWIESAQPVPQWHDQKPAVTPTPAPAKTNGGNS
jgi:hypothetical protein